MLRSMKEIIGYHIHEPDGRIGRCKDFLVDERHWTVRYIVIDTGKWLSEQLVIITPSLVGDPDWNRQMLPIQLTKEELQDAPPIDKDAPVSRRYEKKWLSRFNQPFYWAPMGPTGAAIVPPLTPSSELQKARAEKLAEAEEDETHLRSIAEIIGYDIHAVDGDIGVVDEFVMDDKTWIVRYFVVNTHRWLPGGKVLLSTDWIDQVSWSKQKVDVDATIRVIKESPPFDPAQAVNREYEVRLYDYYGRPKYWQDR